MNILHSQVGSYSVVKLRYIVLFLETRSEQPVGLYVFPRLLPRDVQIKLLNDLLHTQLSNPAHLTNLHTHYDVPYPTPSSTAAPPSSTSFFDPSATNLILQPHDPEIHKPLTTSQVLSRKLRWMTLGGQYDWTEKAYPATESPESTPHFPIEIARLIQGLFPAITPQAAIVNVYSPGDTLSLHRDVSEECERPLVSVSIGCEALFVVGLDDAVPDEQPLPSTDATAEALQHNGIDGVSVAAQTKSVHAKRTVTLRLRSGDVLVMAGESRKAWHSVPRILPDTCPEWLADWPCMNQPRSEHVTADSASRQDAQYEAYRGWMRGKRLNLNVRQMHE